MKKIGIAISMVLAATLTIVSSTCVIAGQKEQTQENVVVVIDPGHGGKNLGAQIDDLQEKKLDFQIAQAMYDRLQKYEGVTVYMTRESDADMSLKQRAQFAIDKDADFLFCIHLNMSAEHIFYGAEVWVPSIGPNYVKGYQFGSIVLGQLNDLGIYNRGIKNRVNEENEEYYGILRHCEAGNIPSVIIEHCHLDHANDEPFYKPDGALEKLGQLDADAVAKYFGLSSEELGVDYSEYVLESVEEPESRRYQDGSEPDELSVTVCGFDEKSGELSVAFSAYDAQTNILYYDYSLDGGQTYSEVYPTNWSGDVSFQAEAEVNEEVTLIVRVYNQYDRRKESDPIYLGVVHRELEDTSNIGAENALATYIGYETDAVEEQEDTKIQRKEIEESNLTVSGKADVTDLEAEEATEAENTQNELAAQSVFSELENNVANNSKADENTEKSTVSQENTETQKTKSVPFETKFLIAMFVLLISVTCVVFSAILSYRITRNGNRKRYAKELLEEEEKCEDEADP